MFSVKYKNEIEKNKVSSRGIKNYHDGFDIKKWNMKDKTTAKHKYSSTGNCYNDLLEREV